MTQSDPIDLYEVIPTSASSAECQPVVLWQTDQRRLVFKPTLVANPHAPDAPLHGDLVYQRKGKADAWENHNRVPLNRLKAGDGVRIELKSVHLQTLLRHAAALYRYHAKEGLPTRKIHLLKVDTADLDPDALEALDVTKLVRLASLAGKDVVADVLAWLTQLEDPSAVIARLKALDATSLGRVSALTGLTALKSLHAHWSNEIENPDEDFWQTELRANTFALSQLFAYPVVFIRDKAYLGGKSVEDTGGALVDFLGMAASTHDAILIEIKSPSCRLLGAQYRDGVYPASADLSGGVVQTLRYRSQLMRNYYAVEHDSPQRFNAAAPACLLLAGNSEELNSPTKKMCFSLVRQSSKDLMIVTFDELVAKLGKLVQALEEGHGVAKG